MRILDGNNNVLGADTVDPEAGRLVPDTIIVEHPAVEAVAEQGYYVTVAEYPNGGKDVEWVVDVAGVTGREAWTETEEVMRYTPFTAAELATRQIQTATERLRGSDAEVLDALEGLFGCTSLTDFLAALAAAGEGLKDTLEARRALRAEIAALEKDSN